MAESLRDPSILALFESAGREAPRLRLRQPGEETPTTPPEIELRASRRYLDLGSIAHGGVGEVLKGRDVDLGRDVAIKILRDRHVESEDVVRRFVEEAQIGGQLTHPGIVPVYELGLRDDDRPFFAMKLVKGETLAAILKSRREPHEDRRRHLVVFEQVCRTIGYAHSRGVVHRDLKPSNVMVGAFGEVQVLDWGFAKVLSRGGVADERRPTEAERDRTIVATVRSGSVGSQSVAGSVLGTPAYMPPEQALGQVEELDERSDVFSLGAILCEILTGLPPYVGDGASRLARAARCDLDDALARLDACGGEAPMVDLARRSLSPAPGDRPRDAGQLAEAVAAHLSEAETRAHRADVGAIEARERAARDRASAAEERAAVEAARREAEEERARAERAKARTEAARAEATDARRARRQVRAIAAAAVLAIVVAAGGFLWISGDRAGRRRDSARAVDEAVRAATVLREQGRFEAALAEAEKARKLSAEGDDATRDRARRILAEVREARRRRVEEDARRDADRRFLDALAELAFRPSDSVWAKQLNEEYVEVFRSRGVDLDTDEPAAAATILRESSRPDLVAQLIDEWALYRILWGENWDATPLLAVARLLDPDPGRNRLRDAIGRRDLEALRALARSAEIDDWPVRSLGLLGHALHRWNDAATAAAVLRRSEHRFPDDVMVQWMLSRTLLELPVPDLDGAVRHAMAARALRPESPRLANALAVALDLASDYEAAADALVEAARLDPDDRLILRNLAPMLGKCKRDEEALEAFRRARELSPHDGHLLVNLANFHSARGNRRKARELHEEAIPLLRRTLARDPDDSSSPWQPLANALYCTERYEEAYEAIRKAIELSPSPGVYLLLGDSLAELDRLDEAIVAFTEGEHRWPRIPEFALRRGRHLLRRGRVVDAIADLARAKAKWPDEPGIRNRLVRAYLKVGRHDDAIALCRQAIDGGKGTTDDWTGISQAQFDAGRVREAVATAEETVAGIGRDSADCWLHLGFLLSRAGDQKKALEANRRAAELDPTMGLAWHNVASGEWHARDVEGLRKACVRALEEGLPKSVDYARIGSYLFYDCLDYERALEAFRKALELDSTDWNSRYLLGTITRDLGRTEEAIELLGEAVKIDEFRGGWPLSGALLDAGRIAEAREILARCAELAPVEEARIAIEAMLRMCDEALRLMPERDAILAGTREPTTEDELDAMMSLCGLSDHHLAAARLALREIEAGWRDEHDWCGAAIAAAQAGCGRGVDTADLTEEERARWRTLALDWFREGVEAQLRILEKGEPSEERIAAAVLRDAHIRPGLACVRDPAELAKLPEAEREAWLELWRRIEAAIPFRER